MDRVGDYLRLPELYCDYLGGLRWSPAGEAVEYADGETFAFNGELALFLEGFASGGRLIHIGFILHLLHLLGRGRRTLWAEELQASRAFREAGWLLEDAVAQRALTQQFVKAFRDAGRPLRNSGALCAILCRDVLPVADPLDPQAVCRRLSSGPLMHSLYVTWLTEGPDRTVELPYLSPGDFEARVLAALKPLTEEELRSWFRHGRGPIKEAGEEVARQLAALQPRSLAGILSQLAQNPRLSGAVPFVAQLVSALALPPRRMARPELPLGGYADVTTRGQPEHLLPSQFGLEDLEFIRRYAEKELLYFRREEPHARTEEELVVLLDQGVRTWGDVRLVLGAAVFAFGKLAVRRGRPFRVAATSAPGVTLDPLEADDQALAELLEASDLGPHPGLALERVLEEPATVARDVVLLTHPRNLAEEDVQAAARRVGPGTRLFAVAADGHGDVQLCELKHGTPVKLAQFRVDLTRAAAPIVPAAPPAVPAPLVAVPPWQGNVEPIGFPFRFGIHTEVEQFAFDDAGAWLLTVARQGMLYAWEVDGSRAEVLPRPWWSGRLLFDVDVVLGVAGGFVLGLRARNHLLAAHYDFGRRRCRVHSLGPADQTAWEWYYFRAQHAVVLRERGLCRGVDLTTGESYDGPWARAGHSSRVRHACQAAQAYLLAPPEVYVAATGPPPEGRGPTVHLDRQTGKVTLTGVTPAWAPFTPMADGLPMLRDCEILQAQLQGNTLGLLVRGAFRCLRLFRGPAGRPLGEYPLEYHRSGFALGNEGRRVAWWTAPCEVVVRDTAGEGKPPLLATRAGRCHQGLQVELGENWLTVRIDRLTHLFRWDRGPLEHTRTNLAPTALQRTGLLPAGGASTRVAASKDGARPDLVRYDPFRFVAAAWAGLYAVLDVFGHVSVFDRSGCLVCMFFVFREHAAIWMPDGTRYGPAALGGDSATPGALEKLGRALRATAEPALEYLP
jgi:hypothetical protein